MMRKVAPVALIAFLSFATSAFAAWTAPTSAPPNGNIDAPLTTGSAVQTKTGAFGNLQLSSLGTAPSPVTNKLYNIGGTLYFNGSSLSGGVSVASGGSGTANYLSKFTGATTLGNSQIFDNGSTVGVGTTGGSAKLQVNGASQTWGVYSTGATNAYYGSGGSGYGGYFIGTGGVYAQNSSGYYAFLGYPGTYWSVYGNGYVYAPDYYVASTGRWLSSLGGGGGSGYWTEWGATGCGSMAVLSCAAGYSMTQIQWSSTYTGNCNGTAWVSMQMYCEQK